MANLEGFKEKFIVINNQDLNKYVGSNGLTAIEAVEDIIKANRILDERKINNKYLVINTDELYADEVIEILKRNGHWG